jgi:hypothetical protein
VGANVGELSLAEGYASKMETSVGVRVEVWREMGGVNASRTQETRVSLLLSPTSFTCHYTPLFIGDCYSPSEITTLPSEYTTNIPC